MQHKLYSIIFIVVSGSGRPEVLIYDTKQCEEGLKYKRWDETIEIEENWHFADIITISTSM